MRSGLSALGCFCLPVAHVTYFTNSYIVCYRYLLSTCIYRTLFQHFEQFVNYLLAAIAPEDRLECGSDTMKISDAPLIPAQLDRLHYPFTLSVCHPSNRIGNGLLHCACMSLRIATFKV